MTMGIGILHKTIAEHYDLICFYDIKLVYHKNRIIKDR